ncbi:hypothetical protein JL721_13179 [Aureococcus anophagefferens]|nr:hypothetical protein JL721_13179 [Aureococcus anophagefferens]
MADAAPPDAPEEEADPVLRSAMAKLEQAALRYDSVRDKQSLRAFDGASMNAASFQQQLQRAFPSLRLSEPEAYALLACFDNDGGGTIDGAEFMKTFFSRSFAIKADGDRAARNAKAARAAKEVRKQDAAARAKRKAMDARYDANFSDEDMLVARRRICAAAEHYDADNTDAMPLTGFQGAEMHPAVFEDQLKRCFHVTFTPKQLGAVVSIFARRRRRRRRGVFTDLLPARLRPAAPRHLEEVAPYDFGDLSEAVDKIIESSVKYDKRSIGPGGLQGFEGSDMTPTVFREQLKRAFNVRLNPRELGAAVDFFDQDGSGTINCPEFLSTFFDIGTDARHILCHILLHGGDDRDARYVEYKKQLLGDRELAKTKAALTARGPASSESSLATSSAASPGRARTAGHLKRPPPGGLTRNTADLVARRLEGGDSLLPLHGVLDLSAPARDDAVVAKPAGSDPVSTLDALETTTLDGDADRTFAASLAAEVATRPFLRQLWLTNCPELPALPPNLCGSLPNLTVLGLANVRLRRLPDDLGLLRSLERLHADGNALDALPASLDGLVALRELTLARNAFFDVPVGALPRRLRALSLADNALDVRVEDLRPLTRKLKLLVALDLRATTPTSPSSCAPSSGTTPERAPRARRRAEPPGRRRARGARLAVRTAVDDELYAMLKNRARKRAEAK